MSYWVDVVEDDRFHKTTLVTLRVSGQCAHMHQNAMEESTQNPQKLFFWPFCNVVHMIYSTTFCPVQYMFQESINTKRIQTKKLI